MLGREEDLSVTTETCVPEEAAPSGRRALPPRSGGAVLAWLFTACAGYAVAVAVVTQDPSRIWGIWAAAGYILAALLAWRSRGSAPPLLIGACAAVAAPTIWLAVSMPPGSEPAVVARAAFLLVHHGSPYLPSGQLLSAAAYNPYLPAMSVFGLPSLARLPGVAGNPGTWMALATLALAAAAIGIGLPALQDRADQQEPGARTVLRGAVLAVVTPVLALPIALGTTDPPVIALMCLALACAGRPADSRPLQWLSWNGLAALAIGSACAMKATAWPALPVIAVMIAARQGPRAAARFTGATAAVAVVLTAVFAPALIAHPRAFFDNIIAYPLGLARHLTPAASPLPGHMLASAGAAGRVAAIAALLAAGAAVAASLVLRPPRTAQAAAVRLAVGFTVLFTLAPNTRFGYFAYPAALLGWLILTGRWRPRLKPGQRQPAEDAITAR